MEHKKLFSYAFCAYLSLFAVNADNVRQDFPYGYPETNREKLLINSDWKFIIGNENDPYFKKDFDDSKWENVCVPHTLELTSIKLNGYDEDKTQPTFMRKIGWYRRNIHVDGSGKKVFLEFEGAHQITTLWVNGKEVGVHKTGGYTPFIFDITDYVTPNADNQITLRVDNRKSEVTPPDPGPFDYIKFGGLYRDVYLVETDKLHITHNIESMNSGVTITTPSVDYVNGNATIDIRTEVVNETNRPQKATLVQRVVDADGDVVLKLTQTAVIAPNMRYRFCQTGGIEDDVKFWDLDSPYLYKVNTVLYDESGKAIDVVDNRLGLRKVEYDPETGFRLNGKNIELIGFNRHQHYAYIGDAMPNSLHYKDMKQLKQLGMNCVRTAHYPQDDEIIKACDELGLLVYEEAPTWISISHKNEWYENAVQAARVMVRNHKNSPSVIIWGTGINHRGPVPEMQFAIKQEDPTRLTSSQSSRWTGWQCSGWTDIFGNMNYGPGIWDRHEPLLAMEGNYGPEAIAPYKRDPMMPGMISWTAHAYYTFHDFGDGDEKTRLGALDAFRYPKSDSIYWYPAEFVKKPYIHVVNPWDGKRQDIVIYSNAPKIEVLVNGKSYGMYKPSDNLKYDGLDHAPYIISDIPYEAGELKVRGFYDGAYIEEKSVFTPQKAYKLNLIADTYDMDFKADGNDIMVVHAEVLDENGMRLKDYKGEIKFTVKGDAEVIGDKVDIEANPVKIRRGNGSALIRAGRKPGKIEITATSKGLKSASVNVETVKADTDCMLANAYPIYDKETVLMDMGAEGQLLQFGWTPWIIKDGKEASVSVRAAQLNDLVAGNTPPSSEKSEIVSNGTQGVYNFTIRTVSGEGLIRSLGEMNVIGKNGFVYGDGILCLDKDGLYLELKNLPAGEYSLMTYHHAPSSNTNSMDPNLERLKKESIHKLPYSKTICISVNDKIVNEGLTVSAGKECQYNNPTTAVIKFKVEDNSDTVTIKFKSTDRNSGIWLNGFELERFL